MSYTLSVVLQIRNNKLMHRIHLLPAKQTPVEYYILILIFEIMCYLDILWRSNGIFFNRLHV